MVRNNECVWLEITVGGVRVMYGLENTVGVARHVGGCGLVSIPVLPAQGVCWHTAGLGVDPPVTYTHSPSSSKHEPLLHGPPAG